ncbi:hypothetical protein ANCDUO_08077 [Ancylostoma duodenale]|uniref:Uncharacterized protein n=1 Tax=Ancylostoma duodenale TaxID=51022 RepID=A0A0C2GK85_9BILA|nr:hypothetical protein ANCDUO_08077 [Ancylostoma duodenale]
MSEELVNPVELEALLLDEPTQSEQLASMIATLDKLMQTVQGIAKQNVAQVSQHYVPAPSTSRSGEASIIYAQLNTDEFRNVEYHLEFDPIAAAQGELRGLQPLNPKVLKQKTSRTYKVADFVMNRGFLTIVENDQMRKVVPPSKRKDVFNEALHVWRHTCILPEEDRNEYEWKRIGEVCTEFVRYITEPSRNFDALVRDHYGDVLEQSPHTHRATCLGTDPSRKRAPYTDRQILLFLEKLRLIVNDVIRFPEFEFASPELKAKRRRDKMAKAKRRRDEMRPNYFVIEDPHRQRHTRTISFEEHREPRLEETTPRGRSFEKPAKRDRRRDSMPPTTDERLPADTTKGLAKIVMKEDIACIRRAAARHMREEAGSGQLFAPEDHVIPDHPVVRIMYVILLVSVVWLC